MSDLIIKLSKLPPNKIHNYLMENYARPMHEGIKAEVAAFKKKRKAEKLKAYHQHALWQDLLRDMSYELANTIVGRNYKAKRPTPERDAAFDAYIKVMGKLRDLIKHNYMALDTTPSVLAKEKGVPNNGEHWTDWVPEHVKERIHTLFDGIPYTPKTKRKLPFQRTARPMRRSSKKTKREVLTETARNELELVERTITVADTEKLRNKRKQLRQVLDWLESATDSMAMPRTWHGVLKLLHSATD